jgi:PHD/YefM family antitoxin component YafN of YafNO toxin-antitoxin module
MKLLELDQATASLAEYAREAKHDLVLLTEHGHPVAALLSLENMDAESLSLSTNSDFLEIIEQSRARLAAEGGISSDEIRRRFGLASRKKKGAASG